MPFNIVLPLYFWWLSSTFSECSSTSFLKFFYAENQKPKPPKKKNIPKHKQPLINPKQTNKKVVHNWCEPLRLEIQHLWLLFLSQTACLTFSSSSKGWCKNWYKAKREALRWQQSIALSHVKELGRYREWTYSSWLTLT